MLRGIGLFVCAVVLVQWWLTPKVLSAPPPVPVADGVTAELDEEPVCASWSFGEAQPAPDGVDIPVTIVVAPCPESRAPAGTGD